jgi:hypothetical protein
LHHESLADLFASAEFGKKIKKETIAKKTTTRLGINTFLKLIDLYFIFV